MRKLHSHRSNRLARLLGEAVLAVLVANSAHDEEDSDRRKAERDAEGGAGAEVVLRRAVEVFEGQVRL